MESNILPVTKKSIWARPRIVFPIVFLSVAFAVAAAIYVTAKIPKQYTATSKLQIGTSGELEKTALSPELLATLANDAGFQKSVAHKAIQAGHKNMQGVRSGDFQIKAVLIEKTPIIEVSVEAPSPASAQVLANISAKVLIKNVAKLKSSSSVLEYMNERVSAAIEPIDKELRALRREQYILLGVETETASNVSTANLTKIGALNDQISAKSALRTQKVLASSPADELSQIERELIRLRSSLLELQKNQDGDQAQLGLEKALQIANLNDKISAKESLRRSFSEFLSTSALRDITKDETIKVIYPAEKPEFQSNPSWSRNLGAAALAGLLVAIMALSISDPFFQAGQKDPLEAEATSARSG